MAGAFCAERDQGFIGMIAVTAAEATPRWRTHGVVLEPLRITAVEGPGIRLVARQPAIGHTGTGLALQARHGFSRLAVRQSRGQIGRPRGHCVSRALAPK